MYSVDLKRGKITPHTNAGPAGTTSLHKRIYPLKVVSLWMIMPPVCFKIDKA
jgi:hypothetical protein